MTARWMSASVSQRRQPAFMDVEIIEIAERKAFELGENVFPVDKGVIELDEEFLRPLRHPVMVFGHMEEYPVFFRDLHDGFGSLKVDFQGGCLLHFPPLFPRSWMGLNDSGRQIIAFRLPMLNREKGGSRAECAAWICPCTFSSKNCIIWERRVPIFQRQRAGGAAEKTGTIPRKGLSREEEE